MKNIENGIIINGQVHELTYKNVTFGSSCDGCSLRTLCDQFEAEHFLLCADLFPATQPDLEHLCFREIK